MTDWPVPILILNCGARVASSDPVWGVGVKRRHLVGRNKWCGSGGEGEDATPFVIPRTEARQRPQSSAPPPLSWWLARAVAGCRPSVVADQPWIAPSERWCRVDGSEQSPLQLTRVSRLPVSRMPTG